MIPIAVLARQFREALEVSADAAGAQMRSVRQELDALTDQILDARILDGIDQGPVRVDLFHVETDLP